MTSLLLEVSKNVFSSVALQAFAALDFLNWIFFPKMQLQFDPCRRHKISDGPTAHNSLYILKKKFFFVRSWSFPLNSDHIFNRAQFTEKRGISCVVV